MRHHGRTSANPADGDDFGMGGDMGGGIPGAGASGSAGAGAGGATGGSTKAAGSAADDLYYDEYGCADSMAHALARVARWEGAGLCCAACQLEPPHLKPKLRT
jgi:hypothetical protein